MNMKRNSPGCPCDCEISPCAYFRMDEASAATAICQVDSAANDLTSTSTVNTADGKVNTSREFVGTAPQNLYHATSSGPCFSIQTGGTFYCWIYPVSWTTDSGSNYLLTKGSFPSGEWSCVLGYNFDGLNSRSINLGGSGLPNDVIIYEGEATMGLDQWIFVAGWGNGNGGYGLRVGTVTKHGAGTDAAANTANIFRVGHISGAGNPGNQYFGRIDELGLTASVLGKGALDDIYNAGAGKRVL